jgi:hypothetical protein
MRQPNIFRGNSLVRYPNTGGRVVTWLCVAVLIILSLVPGDARPHTGLSGQWEHFVAYAGTGLIATLAYHRPVWVTFGLCILSSILESLQNLVPGRHPTVIDAIFSTAGCAAGALIGLAWAKRPT